jgi:Flp pilus assembly protein TadG
MIDRLQHQDANLSHFARSRHRGNSVLELALLMPILMAMAFGLVEFGQFMFVRHAFESAARDAMRVAVMSTATQAQVTSTLTSSLAQANVTYNSSWLTITDLGPSSTGTVGNVASVPMGDTMKLTLSTTYSALPNAVRPLSSTTGVGVSAGATVSGICTMVKE